MRRIYTFCIAFAALSICGCETLPKPVYEIEEITSLDEGEREAEPAQRLTAENIQTESGNPSKAQEQKAASEKVESLLEKSRQTYRKTKDPLAAAEILVDALYLKPHKELESEVLRSLSTLQTLQALRLAHQKKYEESMPFFRKAIETDPENPFAYMEHGATLWKMGKADEAISAYGKAIEHKPDYYQALNGRGLILLNQARYDEALKDFEKALEVKPDFYWAIINKGLVLDKKGDIDGAIKFYDRAIKIDPKNGLAYNNRGWAYYQKKMYPQAIIDMNKAVRFAPQLDLVYLNRASVLAASGQVLMAIKDFETFIDRFPNHPRVAAVKEWIEKNRPKPEPAADKPAPPVEQPAPLPVKEPAPLDKEPEKTKEPEKKEPDRPGGNTPQEPAKKTRPAPENKPAQEK